MTSHQFDIEIPEEKEIDPDVTNLGLRITSGSGVRGFYGTERSLSGRDAFNIAVDGYLYAQEQISGAMQDTPRVKELRLVVGRDPRPTGDAIKKALFIGIDTAVRHFNATVTQAKQISLTLIDIGINTTPVTQNAVRHFDTIGGFIITASHNPEEWNGYKFLTANNEPGNPYTQHGALLSFARMDSHKARRSKLFNKLASNDEESSKIVDMMVKPMSKYSFTHLQEGVREESLEAYFQFLRTMMGLEGDKEFREFVDRTQKADIPVILDHNGGAARTIMADIHRRFGLKVEEMGGELGVALHRIEPEGEALTAAKKCLEQAGRGFAVVHDWDADRGTLVLLSDEGADDLGPQYTCALNLHAMITQYVPFVQNNANEKRPIVAVVNGNTSGSAKVIAERISKEQNVDVRVVAVETGEVNLVEKMEEVARNNTGVPVIGIEGSCGGVIFGGDTVRATSRDGTLSALMAAKLMVSSGKTLSSVVRTLPTFHTSFKSIDGIYVPSVEIKQALEEDFKRRIVNTEDGLFKLTGFDGNEYTSYKIIHYIGTEVYDTMDEGTNGGYKIRLTDKAGNESFLWYRDSKTEPEIYIESDSTNLSECRFLFELINNVVMRVNSTYCAKFRKGLSDDGSVAIEVGSAAESESMSR